MERNEENLLSIRRLTISERYVPDRYQGGRTYPMIRISGNWLEQSGFHIGDKITVEVYHDKIVLIPPSI